MQRRQVILGGLMGSLSFSALGHPPDPVVTTQAGRMRGTLEAGSYAFLGIPYGQDTGGANRFMPPRKPEPWPGVRPANAYGHKAMQSGEFSAAQRPGRPTAWASFGSNQPESEDCLVLNVWTPDLAPTGKRPVMFWIHGGGFFMGSGSEPRMNGAKLARTADVVVVTINHRLGPFGYLYLAGFGERYADSTNIAQLDIVAALTWVRDNIAAFGGDPGNVMVFGNSGGGSKICTLMAMPAARGLFHKAIVQSGSYLACRTPEEATRAAQALMKKLGLDTPDVERLKQAPPQAIMKAYWELGRENRPIAPVIDARTIPFHPYSPESLELYSDVPLMTGSTYTEAATLLGDPTMFAITWDTLPQRWQAYIASLGKEISIQEARTQIDALRAGYPRESAPFIFFRGASDLYTIFAAIIIADRKSGSGAPTYLYELAYTTPIDGGKWGSPHGLDVPLIFLNTDKAPSIVPDNADARAMARIMSTTWSSFARHGHPDNRLIPAWTAYNATARPAMALNLASHIMPDYRGWDRRTIGDMPRLII